eukprot:c19619_g1_i1.p1 GENE.c19619_g1_i1~~c19619_g1_i1.p1  ORF type:complete len:151 (-),score=38.00 c19619_g1_i1:35-487(-)
MGNGESMMNDVTTDTSSPVVYPIQVDGYPVKVYEPKNLTLQPKLYPDIKPLNIGSSSFGDVLRVCKDSIKNFPQGKTQIVFEEADEANKTFKIQAIFSTKLLGFKDDLVFELKDGKLQCRSKSRLGRNDFGANAKRISALFEKISQDLHI